MFENHELDTFLHAFSLRKSKKAFERNGHLIRAQLEINAVN